MTFRSRPLLDLAKGQDCMACIPGVCNRNPETVVSCHKNGGGMGMKHSDALVAWCCSACHDVIDGRAHKELGSVVRDTYWQQAHERTVDAMFVQGLIQVAGSAARGKLRKAVPKILPRSEYRR